MRDRERWGGAETQAEGEAGSLQGARCETGSQDPRITPWAEGRCSTAEPPRRPSTIKLLQGPDDFTGLWKEDGAGREKGRS